VAHPHGWLVINDALVVGPWWGGVRNERYRRVPSDRVAQNLRRYLSQDVQYFAAVEPQRHLAPHVHIAIRGTIARAELRKVLAASYHQVWWPDTPGKYRDGDQLPVWDDQAGRYVDPATGEILPTWDEALDGIGPYDLRHTGNTLTATAGASLRELMDRMGHSSPRAALIYLHGSDARQRAIADGLNRLVEANCGAVFKAVRIGPRSTIGHVAGTRGKVGVVTPRAEPDRMQVNLGLYLVGRTRFELVTSSVSGNFGVSATVGLSRTRSP
jgi:hypothetical protein